MFGWQNFQLSHPDDWGPVSLTGTREQGYCRLASPTNVSLQIRWHMSKTTSDIDATVEQYLANLRKAAAKSKTPFRTTRSASDYTWQGDPKAVGTVIHASDDRVFIIELVGDRKAALKSLFNEIRASFTVGTDLWSVLGLRVCLSAKLSRHQFKAGKTELEFTRPGEAITATRWGLGHQLLQEHSLENWARAALRMRTAALSEEGYRVRLTAASKLQKSFALAQFDEASNQITTVKSVGLRAKEPSWDWIIF